MNRFDGFLFSKLHLIGSKSEGPSYFLQQFDYREVPIDKHTWPWQEDKALQECLGTKVTLHGSFQAGRLKYEKVTAYEPVVEPSEHKLDLDLKLEAAVLWVNKMLPATKPQYFDLELLVRWPYRSIWYGICPTTQLYDFIVQQGDTVIWQWSRGRHFLPVTTQVDVAGGDWHTYKEIWPVIPSIIPAEGDYDVRAVFIAARQEVVRKLTVKFAH